MIFLGKDYEDVLRVSYLNTLNEIEEIIRRDFKQEWAEFMQNMHDETEVGEIKRGNYLATVQLLKDLDDERRKIVEHKTDGGLCRGYHK